MSVNSAVQPPPDAFGPYEVYERLGLGGMAVVHRAKKRGIEGFERSVALKRILAHLAENRNFVVSFIREAKVSSLLVHPNIAQVYDFGRIDGVYYIAMELVQGFDIRKLLHYASRTGESIPLPVLLSILSEMAEALDYAHTFVDEHGQHIKIVHRDISPSNLIVDHSGHLKVIDFGIAKASTMQQHTESGQVKGKLGYMSPEAALGMNLEPVSDLFSMGVVAWELVTASPLFSSRTDFETMWRIREAEIPPPSVHNPSCPPELDALILGALDRNAARRLPSAGAFRAALDALATHYGFHHSPRHVAEWLTKFAQPGDAWVRPSLQSFSMAHPVVEAGATNVAHRRSSASRPHALVQRSEEQAQLAREVWGEHADSGEHDEITDAGPGSPLTRSVPPLVGPSSESTIAQPQSYATQPYVSMSQSAEPPGFAPRPAPRSRLLAIVALLAVVAAALGAILVVQTLRSAPPPPAATVPVHFVAEPSDAVIQIAGQPVGKNVELPAGEHLVTAKLDGYKAWARAITVRPNEEQTVAVALERVKAHLTIESEPPGLAIEIDGKDSGYKTPASFEQQPGTHQIVIRNGNEVWTKELVAEVDGKHMMIAKLSAPAPTPPVPVVRQRLPYHRSRERIAKPELPDKPAEAPPVLTAEIKPAPPPEVEPPVFRNVVPAETKPVPAKMTRIPVVAAGAVAKLSGEVPTLKASSGETNSDALVKMCIDTNGKVTSVKVVRSTGAIASELSRALSSWRYEPYMGTDGPSAVCFPLQLRLVFKSGD